MNICKYIFFECLKNPLIPRIVLYLKRILKRGHNVNIPCYIDANIIKNSGSLTKIFDSNRSLDAKEAFQRLYEYLFVTASGITRTGKQKNMKIEIYENVPFFLTPPDSFQRAAMFGDPGIIQILAPLIKNPNAPDPDGCTTMDWAASSGHLDVIKVLAPFTDNPNAPNSRGWTPIQRAAITGQAEVIKLLAVYTTNPNAKAPDGLTPLQYARMHGYMEVIKVLESFTSCDQAI